MTDFPHLGINTRELIAEVERLLEEARDHMSEMGAVNWGDIGVHEVEYRLSMLHPQDGPRCVVTIEEAAPDCELAKWLNSHLDAARFPNVFIECAW